MKRLLGAFVLAAFHLAILPGLLAAQTPAQEGDKANGARDSREAARALAQRIDKLISARQAALEVKPAGTADDARFLRRLHLDLSGRIPSLLDVRDYLDDDRPNKRDLRIEDLLSSEAYARHFANIWRALMLQGTTNNQQTQGLQPGFEMWLRQHLQNNTPYDKLVHELITSSPFGGNPRGPGNSSPVAFFFANENKPENLAGATSRVFLGVKIECAQCHPHPFAKWSKNQFWEYAAFFSGTPNQGVRGRGGVPVNQFSREIRIPNTDKVAKARFLDGKEPQWKDGVPTTKVLADWMTSAENPYFAKAAVDHLWYYFFGVSLMEPIIEPSDDNPITHPELLEELAKEFTANNFDLKFLIRAIVQTEAYQRTSGPAVHKDDVLVFARMPVRGLTPEQLFDSVAEATDYLDPYANQNQIQQFNPNAGPVTPRQAFLAKFTSQDKRIETHTSILQALFMMNGKFLAERTKLENNKSLFTIATAPTSTARRVETLYLLVLSRLPTEGELAARVRYIESGGPTRNPQQAVADVYWALLNSGEFMLNH